MVYLENRLSTWKTDNMVYRSEKQVVFLENSDLPGKQVVYLENKWSTWKTSGLSVIQAAYLEKKWSTWKTSGLLGKVVVVVSLFCQTCTSQY